MIPANQTRGRRHVDNDFRPYLCITEECKESHPRYSTFEEWFQHMQQHGQRWHQEIYLTQTWICPLCEDSRHTFENSHDLLSHMQELHSDQFTTEQLGTISRQSRTQLPRPQSVCPLCCYKIEEPVSPQNPGSVKRQGAQSPSAKNKIARKSVATSHPTSNVSIEMTDYSSDEDIELYEDTDTPISAELARAVARHIAAHFQMLTFLTIRLASLQKEQGTDGDGDGDIKSVTADIDVENSFSHDQYPLSVSSIDTDEGMESVTELEAYAAPKNDIQDSEAEVNWDGVPLCDEVPIENDEFRQKVIESGAFQSHGSPIMGASQPLGPTLTPLIPGRSVISNSLKKEADEVPQLCESCETMTSPIWSCSYCDMLCCDSCWPKIGAHRPGRVGGDGLPHEKANPRIVSRLREILYPPADHEEQQRLHVVDSSTTWFGIHSDNDDNPVFQDYGRYPTIMADSNTGMHETRYPSLVSFVGQTGAGKSTLIKMLIDQQERVFSPGRSFPSPVVGTPLNNHAPTTGDVHLYSDPASHTGEFPMLYADCEGLEGGEYMPISAQYNRRPRLAIVQRDIEWAKSPNSSKRQYAVTQLYPRLLYTFSDVIVFVLRNAKYVYYCFRSTMVQP